MVEAETLDKARAIAKEREPAGLTAFPCTEEETEAWMVDELDGEVFDIEMSS